MRSNARAATATLSRCLTALVVVLLVSWAAPAAAQVYTIAPSNLEELRGLFRYAEGSPPLLVAHRGGRGNAEFPENSLALFDHVLRHTHAIIETDFTLTRDGEVVMMHDETLDRTTTGSGKVVDYTLDEIRNLNLRDGAGLVTSFRTNSLREVLEWSRGRTILAVDVKAPLTFERVIREIVAAGAESRVFIQTYNVTDALTVYRLHPQLMMSTSIKSADDLAALRKAGVPLENVIAHTGSQEPEDPALYDLLRDARTFTMVGTLGRMDRDAAAGNDGIYRALLRNGATIISTDRPTAAAAAIRGMIDARRLAKPPFGISRE